MAIIFSLFQLPGTDCDFISIDAHLEPTATPVQNWCKFTLEWSYKLFLLKYVFISERLQVLLRKLVKRKKLFQNNFIWKASKLYSPAL